MKARSNKAMALTQYALELVLDYLFTTGTATRPTAWYLAWHIGPPGDDGSANEQTTGGDADYARQSITFDSSEWVTAAKKRLTSNTNTISITPATSTSYTIYGFSVWDALTGGNCLIAGETKSPIAVSDVSPLSLVAGKIPVTVSWKDGYGLTSHGAGLLLDWLLTTDSVTRPTDWYAALHTADPGDDGSANEVDTGDDPDYVRKTTDFDAATSITGGDTYTRNNVAAVWVPGTGADFTASHLTVKDALTSGNALYSAACVPPREGLDGQTLSIAAKDIIIKGKY
jgi:hypothetical protein